MGATDSKTAKADRISLADEEGVKRVIVNSVLWLWEVVNNLTRLRLTKHDRYRVTIFGSARIKPGSFTSSERAAFRLRHGGRQVALLAANELLRFYYRGYGLCPPRP